MSGFSTKLKDRLHGILSDIVIETPNANGFPLADDAILKRIKNSPAGPHIEAVTPTVEAVAMISFEFSPRHDQGFDFLVERQKVTRPVHLVGVDPKGRAKITGFAEFLTDPDRKIDPNFDLDPVAKKRFEDHHLLPHELPQALPEGWPPGVPPPEQTPVTQRDVKGIIVGFALASYKDKIPGTDKMEDVFVIHPGDAVNILTIGAGKNSIEPVNSPFAVAGYIKTEMAEYDSNYVYVPLDYLQALRGTPGRSTHILIKLKDYATAKLVVHELKQIFPDPYNFQVSTWEEKQGALLAAIDVERGILNLLLFLIIGVAGFSILAIFSMIVVEKTRDIGILKSLGASNGGVMTIFLAYGFLLGFVGSVLGTALGVLITVKINEIELWLSHVTGRELFPRGIYYFDKIPTNIEPLNVALVNAGAIGIAVFFSVLPALRAALLNPVRALRYE
jgi:lipoprotein-releasing system permease protein